MEPNIIKGSKAKQSEESKMNSNPKLNPNPNPDLNVFGLFCSKLSAALLALMKL